MKKLPVLFLAFIVAANAAAYNDSDNHGFEFSAGIEFGIENVNYDADPYIAPIFAGEIFFLDGSVELGIGLRYYFFFNRVNDNGRDVFPQRLGLEFGLAYNLALGDASTLSFILENENTFSFVPTVKTKGTFMPALRFTQELDFGDVYAQLGIPFHYMPGDDFGISGELSFGWQSNFGLYLGLAASFSLLHEIEFEGMEMKISHSFRNFTFFARCEFEMCSGGVRISPAIGFMHSF